MKKWKTSPPKKKMRWTKFRELSREKRLQKRVPAVMNELRQLWRRFENDHATRPICRDHFELLLTYSLEWRIEDRMDWLFKRIPEHDPANDILPSTHGSNFLALMRLYHPFVFGYRLFPREDHPQVPGMIQILFERLNLSNADVYLACAELRGRTLKEVTHYLKTHGYFQDDGRPFTEDALRKRVERWDH